MYELYIANKNYSSWSLRSWVLMTELGLQFEEQLIPFSESKNWEKFREFSPTGQVPVLVHVDASSGERVRIWESLAIAEYLADRHPAVWPSENVARAWARSASAEMHSGFPVLRSHCSMNCGVRVALHEVPPELDLELMRLQELWQEGLERFGGPFLAADTFTNVDAFFAPVAFRIEGYGLELDAQCMAYVERLLARESMLKWRAAGENEPWREIGHEREWQAVGELVEDRRAPVATTPD